MNLKRDGISAHQSGMIEKAFDMFQQAEYEN